MYSTIENVQILISILKAYNIKHVITSPGGSSIPIVHSLENDEFFDCYSVVDERSAAYFSMGVAQKINKPVALVCTSGTAACNYLPAITEAHYQKTPILVITADKHPYDNHQLVTQNIGQDNLYQDKCKISVELPYKIDNKDTRWHCTRLLHEALINLKYGEKGPVHINIPIIGSQSSFSQSLLPDIEAITVISDSDSEDVWKCRAKQLSMSKNILVVCGQNTPFSDKTNININDFANKYNCVLAVDMLSNIKSELGLNTYRLTEISPQYVSEKLAPDIIISLGCNIASYLMRSILRNVKSKCAHWVIDESEIVKDPFMKLTTIFRCSIDSFFKHFVANTPKEAINNKEYYRKWKENLDEIKIENLPFSSFYVAKTLAKSIPNNSILHLGILNSIRHMQYFDIDKSIDVYGNIGALGIDGSMSTFMGQACVTNNLAFLLIGDLSFFYDMNSLGIRHVGSNVRILLVNNRGAEEFHFYIGKEKIPSIDKYIAVRHNSSAKGWAESCGFKYLSSSSKEEIEEAISILTKEDSDKPIILEVFSNADTDATVTKSVYNENKILSAKENIKKTVGNIIGDKNLKKISEILKK